MIPVVWLFRAGAMSQSKAAATQQAGATLHENADEADNDEAERACRASQSFNMG